MKVNNMSQLHIDEKYLPFLNEKTRGKKYHIWDFFYKDGEIVGSPHTERLTGAVRKKGEVPTYTAQEILKIEDYCPDRHVPAFERFRQLRSAPHKSHKRQKGQYLSSMVGAEAEAERIQKWISQNPKADQIEIYTTRKKVMPYNRLDVSFRADTCLRLRKRWLTLDDFFQDYENLNINFLNLFTPQNKCKSTYNKLFYALPHGKGQIYVRVYKYGIDKGHLLSRLEECIKKSQG